MTNRHDDLHGGVDEPDESVALPPVVAAALADPAVWAEPPAWLGESIAAAIGAQREADGVAGEPVAAPPQVARRRSGRVLRGWWLAAAAAVIAIVATVVVVLLPDRDGSDGVAVAIGGTELAPGARAEAVVNELAAGVAIRLDIEGLAPAPTGSFYQGWVRSEAGELVSVGTFHLRAGDGAVTLWSGVEVADYPTLTVTLQREGEGTESSGDVVLRGSLLP